MELSFLRSQYSSSISLWFMIMRVATLSFPLPLTVAPWKVMDSFSTLSNLFNSDESNGRELILMIPPQSELPDMAALLIKRFFSSWEIKSLPLDFNFTLFLQSQFSSLFFLSSPRGLWLSVRLSVCLSVCRCLLYQFSYCGRVNPPPLLIVSLVFFGLARQAETVQQQLKQQHRRRRSAWQDYHQILCSVSALQRCYNELADDVLASLPFLGRPVKLQ